MKLLINDFRRVREVLNFIVGRELPLWVSTLYYIVMFPFGLILHLCIRVWWKIYTWRIRRVKFHLIEEA